FGEQPLQPSAVRRWIHQRRAANSVARFHRIPAQHSGTPEPGLQRSDGGVLQQSENSTAGVEVPFLTLHPLRALQKKVTKALRLSRGAFFLALGQNFFRSGGK